MEKNRLLDTFYKSNRKEYRLKNIPLKKRRGKFINSVPFLAVSFLFLMLMTACSLPRIIILDDPLSPEEHINLGVAYERQGLLDNAIEEYSKASKKIPIAYLYLGNAYMQKNDLENAERYYKKAIRENPDSSDVYNNLAWLYYIKAKDSLGIEDKKELLKKAEGLSLKALEIKPSDQNYIDTLEKIRELKSKNGL